MRCIEIRQQREVEAETRGLTLTWDVLKLDYYYGMDTISVGLTLTWDVLK